ncbi:MAG: hypothetical protein IPM54_10245 [Polyangiaceae bacterium]|nr:hypothetical protein [Polyangiaceae bacterium]
MLSDLRANHIAHGDLQHENVLVNDDSGGPTLRLIDYDTVVVPNLVGKPEANAGHPAFQHPMRADAIKTKTMDIDAFSGVAIYTTILAFARDPGLWDYRNCAGRDGILFDPKDFELGKKATAFFDYLSKLGQDFKQLSDALVGACRGAPNKAKPLDEIIAPAQPVQTFNKNDWFLHRPTSTTPTPPPIAVGPTATVSSASTSVATFMGSSTSAKAHAAPLPPWLQQPQPLPPRPGAAQSGQQPLPPRPGAAQSGQQPVPPWLTPPPTPTATSATSNTQSQTLTSTPPGGALSQRRSIFSRVAVILVVIGFLPSY